MGGRPLTALGIVCFPAGGDLAILERIMAGGLSKMMEAGCVVVGGHSIRDEEIKFGYSVTGTINPKRIFANSGARAGDRLVFTKAIGTGVISTAIKRQKAKREWEEAAVHSMTTLNKAAAEVMTRDGFDAHAATDITGFGLIGHGREMAMASDVSLRIYGQRVPLLPGALDCVRERYIPGGLNANRDFAECTVQYADDVPEDVRTVLFDPQTAGGLLVSVAANDAQLLVSEMRDAGVDAVEIGEVLPRTKPLISVQ
jgi:selenide,water dikinase